MNILKIKNGYSMVSDGVHFDFCDDRLPEEHGGLYRLTVEGMAPVPQIMAGDRLLLPVDEGIAITADKKYASGEADCDRLGDRFCTRNGTMSMVIVERERKYLLIALDSGLHSEYRATREDGLYRLEITCHKACGVTYGIFDTLAEACKGYREIKGLSPVSLSQKLRANPEIGKLIGGAIFWVWNDHYDEVMYADHDTDICPEVGEPLLSVSDRLARDGVGKAMFGLFFDGDSVFTEPLYKKYGYLSTQYDNYNDVLDPALLKLVPRNRAKNCGYTARRMKDFPDGVSILGDGRMMNAWALRGYDGQYHSQKTLCPAVAAERMREEIPAILEKYPFYRGRFIDVYGVRLGECHSKVHPVTREQCLEVKKQAFRDLGDMGLIAGTEDGFEDLIDSLVYTEGLHSPGSFRIHECGRKHAHIYDREQAEHLGKNMMDPASRVPLWHLVYHDCLLAFPYWGDSTDASPEYIKTKILFACLYGCAPLYSFFVKNFERLLEDILESYQKITAVHEKVATLPMTSFESLTDDHRVQRSVFGERYEIVANFSDSVYVFGGHEISPLDLFFGEL